MTRRCMSRDTYEDEKTYRHIPRFKAPEAPVFRRLRCEPIAIVRRDEPIEMTW